MKWGFPQKGAVSGRYCVIAAVLALFAMPFAAIQYKVPAILPNLIEDLGLAGNAPWLITSFTLTGVVAALVAGPLTKRIGLRKIMGVAAGFALAGSLLGIFSHEPFPLVVSRGIEGIGFAFVCVVGPIALERFVPDRYQGIANGLWGIWIPLGAFCGEVVSPLIYSSFGFVGVWGFFALAVLLFSALVVAAEKASLFGKPLRQKSEGEAKGVPFRLRDFGMNFVPFLVAWLSFNLLNFAVMSYGPSYMQSVGFDQAASGFATTIPMLLSIATGPIGGAIIDKTGKAKELLIVALVANAITVVMLFTVDGALIWLAVILMGLFATLSFVATLSSVYRVIRNKAAYALAISLYMFVQCGGELAAGLLSPILLGPELGDWTMLAFGCGVVGVVGVVCAIATRFASK